MKIRNSTLILAGSLLAGLLVGTGATAASAGQSSGPVSVFTSGVFNYRDYPTIETNPGQVRGQASIKRDGATTPTNYAGANARYFLASSDALIAETGFRFNSSPFAEYLYMTVSTSLKNVSSGGGYYAWGVVKGSNSSSYATYYTFKSATRTT